MENSITLVDKNEFISEVESFIEKSVNAANSAVSSIVVVTYWNVGRMIVEEEQNGKSRAEYGKQIIQQLSERLTRKYGNNYSKRNLQYYRKFYQCFNDLEIVNTCVHNLNWSHFRRLLSVTSDDARIWYTKEACEQMWSVRTLDRNIATQYYERLLLSPKKDAVIAEMKSKTASYKDSKFELIKNPVIAEFLGFQNNDYSESQLESAILTHIRDFLMELGKGFAFVARQQHIVTESEDYFIDLVFYNIELKCYVLIDLKLGKITHQDVGQMDMYIRMYDELKKKEDDNPTIGIVLCSKTDEDIAKYSILHDSNQIFMAKYMPYMPTQEELKNEIEKYFKEKNIEINLKYIDPSYQVRASVTTAADSIYCERLGNNAVHAAMAGKTKLVIGLVHDKFVHLPIKMVTKHRNAVDPEGSLWRDALDATGQPIHMINDMEKARSKMAEAIAEAKRKPSEQKK